MKRIVFFTLLCFMLFSCGKEKKDCGLPPPIFFLLVNKSSESYKEFINEKGEIDEEHISLYKQENGQKKLYRLFFGSTNIPNNSNEYLEIGTELGFENDVYTGKTETLYLQNATRTYKIEVDGYTKETGCGLANIINEMRVDDKKIETRFLAK